MPDTLSNIIELRNNVSFASISQFFHTFQSAFRPWPSSSIDPNYSNTEEEDYVFETEDLEKMILDPTERNKLEGLMIRMLRLLTRNRFINFSTWQSYFAKEFDKREFGKENPLYILVNTLDQEESIQPIDFFTLSFEKQVDLIYSLCEWQLDDSEKFREHLDSEEGSAQWRVDPIGYNKIGATFWLFDDNRLYLETPKPVNKPQKKKKKRMPFTSGSRKSLRKQVVKKEEDDSLDEIEEEWKPWQLLCCSIQDWENIPLKYANSDNSDEKNFHELLVSDLLPKILPILENREKEIKKQEAIVHRKRSSRIMVRELEALESTANSGLDFGIFDSRTRSSNRLEERSVEKERQERESLAKAREERLLEREKRLLEREYRAMAREKHEQEDEKKHEEKEFVVNKFENLKPKRKYKEKLDDFGNPLPKKKRGRKPKNRDLEEESWFFSCICGVSGKNLDDGAPMIACEKCGTWQHIRCLEQSNQIDKHTSDLDNVSFICHQCTTKKDEIHLNPIDRKQKTDSIPFSSFYSTDSPPDVQPKSMSNSFVSYQRALDNNPSAYQSNTSLNALHPSTSSIHPIYPNIKDIEKYETKEAPFDGQEQNTAVVLSSDMGTHTTVDEPEQIAAIQSANNSGTISPTPLMTHLVSASEQNNSNHPQS